MDRTRVPSAADLNLSWMETATKGNTAEAAVLGGFVQRGFHVLVPFGGGQPYDLLVDLEDRAFLRVQCKTARYYRGCVTFNARTTDHGHGRRPYHGVADAFGVYFPPTQSVYVVPVREASTFTIGLRLGPTRNNQRRGVRFADDYEIARWAAEELHELVRAETSIAKDLHRHPDGQRCLDRSPHAPSLPPDPQQAVSPA